MDILNWIYSKRARLVKTVASDPNKDLVALGSNVGFNKRDDQYQIYAMPLANSVQSGCEGNTKHYELDITQTNVVRVDTPRGIIDITGMGTANYLTPDPSFGSTTLFVIDNLELDLTVPNRDNVYVQFSVYYKQESDDNAIPYLISTGFNAGLEFNLYNASPVNPGTREWQGALYIYYELYTLN